MINMGTPQPPAQANPNLPRAGFIGAKGRVLGPNKRPIWAEIDDKGRVVEEIGEVFEEPLKSARVISGNAWRQHKQAWLAVEGQYGEELEVLSRQEYRGRIFQRPDGSIASSPGVGPDVVSVVVRKEEYLFTESIPLV
ncbi:MAG: hypothetical protein GY909_10755, partial [Oligoflexia bacterium]|nr:hypothetical protein [Oligoflexia bacterium]